MKKKVALIFGITGQDGSYLAEFLLKKIILLMELKGDHLASTHTEWITFIKIHMRKIIIFDFIMEM